MAIPIIDGRSDIYSLGAILFEALTGRQPFEATTPLGVAVKHLTEPIPRLAELNADLPYQCQDVIDKAMAKEREQRYQSAASLAQALMLIASKTLKNPPIPEEEPTARMQPPVPRRVQPRIQPAAAGSRTPAGSRSATACRQHPCQPGQHPSLPPVHHAQRAPADQS